MPDLAYLDQLFATKRRLETEGESTAWLAGRLKELRAWQAARLARTYDDLLRDPSCQAAVEFFLTDLYGPQDFAQRDADLTRAWERLKRGLPAAALEVVAPALELQVLSAELDQAMVARLGDKAVTEPSYAEAYRAVGRSDARRRQIDLVVSIGNDLQRLVKFPLIGLALRAARIPAHLAGFGVLQNFLERGFAAFRQLGDARMLLDAIRERETALLQALFNGSEEPFRPHQSMGARGV
jgi:hypothetical protein